MADGEVGRALKNVLERVSAASIARNQVNGPPNADDIYNYDYVFTCQLFFFISEVVFWKWFDGCITLILMISFGSAGIADCFCVSYNVPRIIVIGYKDCFLTWIFLY